MIFLQHLHIILCLFSRHLVTDNLKGTLKKSGRHDVNEFLRNLLRTFVLELDHLHEFVGIFRLDIYEMLYKILEFRSIRGIQQELKLFKMIIHTV